jgi:hypothetical protein
LHLDPSGLIEQRPSQHLFGFNRRIELALDALNLHSLRFRRISRGLKNAVEEKKILHLWAHPWEFRTEKDFEKLRYIFELVSREIEKGTIQSIGMANLARKFKAAQ